MAVPEHALTQSHVADETFQAKRRTKRTDLVPIPPKWFEVLAMHLAGKATKDILAVTGYSIQTYYRIMADPRTQAVRQQLLSTYQDEFEALFGKVITNIREQLDSDDYRVKQTAQQQWFSAESKFKFIRNKAKQDDSAEDIVSKMLNLNVQVNVAQPASGTEGAVVRLDSGSVAALTQIDSATEGCHPMAQQSSGSEAALQRISVLEGDSDQPVE